MRRRLPPACAAAASMSAAVVRASEATVTRSTAPATEATPASHPATTRRAGFDHVDAEALEHHRRLALVTGDKAMPGDCSPSLRVVSKILILRTRFAPRSRPAEVRAHYFRRDVGVCGVERPRERNLPLEGENEDDRKKEDEPERSGSRNVRRHLHAPGGASHRAFSVHTRSDTVKLHNLKRLPFAKRGGDLAANGGRAAMLRRLGDHPRASEAAHLPDHR